jgi:hypothetical protein
VQPSRQDKTLVAKLGGPTAQYLTQLRTLPPPPSPPSRYAGNVHSHLHPHPHSSSHFSPYVRALAPRPSSSSSRVLGPRPLHFGGSRRGHVDSGSDSDVVSDSTPDSDPELHLSSSDSDGDLDGGSLSKKTRRPNTPRARRKTKGPVVQLTPREITLVKALENAERRSRRLTVQLQKVKTQLDGCRFLLATDRNTTDLYRKYGVKTTT